jgi:hypothetical protein
MTHTYSGEKGSAYRYSVEEPEGKTLQKPRKRLEICTKTNLKEIGSQGVTQNRDQWRAIVNAVMNLRFHKTQTISR